MRALRSRSALDALLSGLAARWRCARKRGQQHRRSHRPVLERLELRQLLSVTQFADDQTPAFVSTPNWDAYSGVVGFQGDFCYSITGGGSDAAKWTFDVTPGQYRVAATWVENATYWSTQSPFTILDGAIPRGVALVNQRQAPDDMVDADAAWEQLGDVYNITGTSLVVQLTNADDGYVIADGIRIERIGDLPAAADISVVEGNVELVQDAGGIDFGTLLTNRSVIKTFTVVNQGSAPLELSNSIAVPFGFSVVTPLGATTLGLGESTTFSVQLGAASADNYAGQIAVASNDPDQPVFNINVSGLVRGVQILDDGMAGVQSGAVWVAGQTVLGFDGDVRYTLAVPGSEVDSTVWTFPVKPGKYRVAATWFASPFFAPDATFSIFDGDAPLGTVSVNQQQTPNDLTDLGKAWENLGGVYTVTGSTLVVKLSNIGTGYVFADAVRIEGQDNINNLRLVRDTGISSTDFITTDRRITGTVASDGPTAGILVSIDLDGDDGPEALILTDALGRFNYTPPNSTPGPYTVRVRSQKWDPALLDYVYGSWATVNFMLQTAANAPLSVTSLSLLNPSGGPPSLPRTTDPTLTGKVANDGPIGGLRVEFDFDGNDTVDAFTRTDAAGEFVYRPMGLATGRQWTVRARASEWNETTQLFTPSAWKSLTFQLDPVEPPAVSLLRLIEDDGESPTDLQTTNPRLTGTVTAQGSVFGLTVEFDHNADGVPEGTALTDYEGNFTYFPQGLDPGQIVIHARARSAAELSNQQTVGPWVAFAFTLVGSTPASVVDLRLLNDTGESDTDSITTDPRLTGRVLREGVQARFSVEFDHNGDGSPDGAVMTDLSGNFRYTPLGLRPGLLSVGARAVTWDASTSRNLYGDWVAVEFTLQTDPVQGNGALPELEGDEFTAAPVAYRRALEVAFSTADGVISGFDSVPGMVDSLLVGGLTPFAVRAAGLSVITGFGAPESRSFSLTLPVQQTVTMDVGQYTVNNTVIINYALTVPDGQTSGPFVFDATISAELSYDEAANGETNLFNLHLGGSYSLTFHAEGNYDSGSGVTWFVGSYTADEFGGASFRAEQNITYQGALGGSSSRVITNLSDMERHETGNFDESGSTAEYDLRQFDDMTFSFSDSGDYSESLTDEYGTETNSLAFENSASGTTSSRLWEEDVTVDPTGATGGYRRTSSGSQTFLYKRSGEYDFDYHDGKTDEISHYEFERTHSGSSSFNDTEDASYDASGATGRYTSTATARNTVTYGSIGYDRYDFVDGANIVHRDYDYDESSSQQLDLNTSESVDFSPTGSSGAYTFGETGSRSWDHYSFGSDSYEDEDQTSSVSSTYSFTNSDVGSSTFDSSESGSYTPTELNGTFSSSTSDHRTRDIDVTVTSDYTYASGPNQASASNSYTENLFRQNDSNGEESGTFDLLGYTGTRRFTQTASGLDEFSGEGSNGWIYVAGYDVNTFGYSFDQSGSASFDSSHTESSKFSPQDSATLYWSSASGTRMSTYTGGGTSERRHEEGEVLLDTALETVNETITMNNGFNRSEAGAITSAGRIGVFHVVETGSETHDTDNHGDYHYRFDDGQTLDTKNDLIDESYLRELSYSTTESQVFSPGGANSAYDHSGSDNTSFSFEAFGDASYHYEDSLTTVDNTDNYEASGLDAHTLIVSDVGSRSAAGSAGLSSRFESSEFRDQRLEWGDSSYEYADVNVVSSNHGSYRDDRLITSVADSTETNAYTPGAATSTTREDNLVEGRDFDFYEDGDSYYADLLRTIAHVFTNESQTLEGRELHTTNAAGPTGWRNTVFDQRDHSNHQKLSVTWTVDGESSTSGFDVSNSTSLPYSETSGEGTPPETPLPLPPPPGDGPDMNDLDSLVAGVTAQASGAYDLPELLDQALTSSVDALQMHAPAGTGPGGGSSEQWFGSPAVGAAFMRQRSWAVAPAGMVTVLSPWEAGDLLPSGIAPAVGQGYVTPAGNSSFSTSPAGLSEQTVASPLLVGRQRVLFGIDTFSAVDSIPGESVGSYVEFRGFAGSLQTLAGEISNYTGAQQQPSFSSAWSGLGSISMAEPAALSILTPIGPSAMDVLSSPAGGPMSAVGLAGGMIVTTASMTPGSVHSELAFMDFRASAADLIGTGTPAFRISPSAGLH